MTVRIRERLAEAAAHFAHLDVALFTSFNFHAEFFERNVLPALFGEDGESPPAAREQLVHRRLRKTRVGVACDPSVIQPGAKRYRYAVYPRFVQGRVFHPKTIVLFGRDAQGVRWIYLAVMSANLTISGWGRNCEGFADTWLHATSEQPVDELRSMLQWLNARPSANRKDALSDGLAFIDQMQRRRSRADPEGGAWATKSSLRFYFSPLWPSMWAFVRQHLGVVVQAHVASPYWGGGSRIAQALEGVPLRLTASLSPPDMRLVGLGRDAVDSLAIDPGQLTTWDDGSGRFFHAKLYELTIGGDTVTGIGSCNFTEAGLFWMDERDRPAGNVEAMLFRQGSLGWPGTRALPLESLAQESATGDDPPLKYCVAVEYDWKRERLSWHVQGDVDTRPLALELPDGGPHVALSAGDGTRSAATLPTRRFFVRDEQGACVFEGLVTEVELDDSTLNYGSPLTVAQILESWQAGTEAEPGGSGGSGGGGTSDEDPDTPATPTVPFDAFAFFQALKRIRARIDGGGEAAREWLVGRGDSVCALADAFARTTQQPAAAWIVLTECLALIEAHCSGDRQLRTARKLNLARLEPVKAAVLEQLRSELDERGRRDRPEEPAQPEALLKWYQDQLKRSHA